MSAKVVRFPGSVGPSVQPRLDIEIPAPIWEERPLCRKCLRVSSVLMEGKFWCGGCALDRYGAFVYDAYLGE